MGQMLTAKQVAEVKGCSYQYVQRIIKEGKLQAQEILNDKNRKTYLVPLEALDEELQQKWYQMNLENPPEEISTPEPVTDKISQKAKGRRLIFGSALWSSGSSTG